VLRLEVRRLELLPLLRRVDEPVDRDFDDELLLRDELPRVEELLRREVPVPVAVLAAF
jgi:hypothetical protein